MLVTNIADRLQSMLSDTRIMKPNNFSEGLDILTGKATDDLLLPTNWSTVELKNVDKCTFGRQGY